jgi:hypothetical protein
MTKLLAKSDRFSVVSAGLFDSAQLNGTNGYIRHKIGYKVLNYLNPSVAIRVGFCEKTYF